MISIELSSQNLITVFILGLFNALYIVMQQELSSGAKVAWTLQYFWNAFVLSFLTLWN